MNLTNTNGKQRGAGLLLPVLAAWALSMPCVQAHPYASGVTTVSEAAELRLKESDRIAVLCEELRKLGVRAVEHPDGFTIQGGAPVQGGVLEPHGDHRLAMSLAVAGLASQSPVAIQDAQIIEESYPEFTHTLQTLGGRLVME